MKTEKIDKLINNFKRKKIHKLKFYIFLHRTNWDFSYEKTTTYDLDRLVEI